MGWFLYGVSLLLLAAKLMAGLQISWFWVFVPAGINLVITAIAVLMVAAVGLYKAL